MTAYHLFQIKDRDSNNDRNIVEKIQDTLIPVNAAEGNQSFGIFTGVFGLATNELYWITMGDVAFTAVDAAIGKSQFQIQQSMDLVPTVRPTEHTARTRAGLYVFRWFDVLNKDVDEIASLSQAAWVTFEGDFDTQVQGLFAQPDRNAEAGKMLLLTWYKNLTVWQDSRAPSDEARQLFIKRHHLTREALPIATRLQLA